MYSTVEVIVKAINRISSFSISFVRVVWYNTTNFGFFCPLPLSTIVYGRLLTLGAPTRLSMGANGRIGDSVYFATGRDSRIDVGDSVFINIGCVIVASQRITIGRCTSIAEYVTIRDQEHHFSPQKGVRNQGFRISPVVIGENCWIGRGAYIGPGTIIGNNSIVGANSVVRGTFPDGVLIAGTPAVIKKVLPAADDSLSRSVDHG